MLENDTRRPNGYWTKQTCAEEALKYPYKKEFENSSSGCYQVARRNGWLDDICIHMKRPPNWNLKWTKEMVLEEGKMK